MSSTIKSLANSLGFKRATAKPSVEPASPFLLKDDRIVHSTPYKAFPEYLSSGMSGMDTSVTMAIEEPLPGEAGRPGAPAPQDARLSMGTQGTTTIRLVSSSSADSVSAMDADPGTPQLKPFATSFDLLVSPGGNGLPALQHGLHSHLPRERRNIFILPLP